MSDWDDLPLGLSQAIMSFACLVISSDSGARLLAVAADKPVISFFGSSVPEATRTYNVTESYVEIPLACRPCNKEICPLGHNDCIKNITTEQIYALAKSRLQTLRAGNQRSQRHLIPIADALGELSHFAAIC